MDEGSKTPLSRNRCEFVLIAQTVARLHLWSPVEAVQGIKNDASTGAK